MGPLRLWTPVVLAPMAGVTDVPFRRLCRIMGESGLPDHLRPTGIPSWAAEPGERATASSPQPPRVAQANRATSPSRAWTRPLACTLPKW